MKNKNYVSIPVEVEHFLSLIFGKKSTHGLAGHHREKVWKQYCAKLIVHLEKYLKANIITDRVHYQNIQSVLNKMKQAVDSNSREPLIVVSLFRLCLVLLGDMPDHWNKKAINRPEYYMLDNFRSINYSQSPAQKANLIMESYVMPRLQGQTRDEEAHCLWKKYTRIYNRKGKHGEFIQWFRENYPKVYVDLFA